jgi:hypothetical protein
LKRALPVKGELRRRQRNINPSPVDRGGVRDATDAVLKGP